MQEEKLNRLQQFLQREVDTAWQLTQNSHFSPHENPGDKEGKHLEFLLQSNNLELSLILDDLALEEYNSLENEYTPPPINFSNYIRYSSRYPNHKEVFVGNEWIIVPADSCIDFGTINQRL